MGLDVGDVRTVDALGVQVERRHDTERGDEIFAPQGDVRQGP